MPLSILNHKHQNFMLLSLFLSLSSWATESQAAVAKSLCNSGESELFVCETKAKKFISICTQDSEKTQPALIYRYGTRKKIELTYPSSVSDSKSAFTKFTYQWPKGSDAQLEFVESGTRYTVFSYSSALEAESHGVHVVPLNGTPKTIHCKPKTRLSLFGIDQLDLPVHERRELP